MHPLLHSIILRGDHAALITGVDTSLNIAYLNVFTPEGVHLEHAPLEDLQMCPLLHATTESLYGASGIVTEEIHGLRQRMAALESLIPNNKPTTRTVFSGPDDPAFSATVTTGSSVTVSPKIDTTEEPDDEEPTED